MSRLVDRVLNSIFRFLFCGHLNVYSVICIVPNLRLNYSLLGHKILLHFNNYLQRRENLPERVCVYRTKAVFYWIPIHLQFNQF